MSDRIRKGFVGAAMIVGSAMFLSRILGFLRNSVIAALFGQNMTTDAYNTAFMVPDTLYLMLIGGGIGSAFIPVLARYLSEKRPDEAWRVTSIAFNLVFVGIASIVLLGLIFAPALVKILAPWFPPPEYQLTVALTRITILSVLFHALNGVLIGAEYAQSYFVSTSVGPLVYNLTVVVAGVALAPSMGIFAFAWATLLGAFFNFIVQLIGVAHLKPTYSFSFNFRHPGVRRVGRLMVPVAVGLSIAQINLVFNQAFLASQLHGGSINALFLASRIMLVPVMIAISIGIALLPGLTHEAATGDMERYKGYLSQALRAVVFLTVPASVGLMVIARPLIASLFQHGSFSATDSAVTAGALTFYCVGIVGYSLYEILSRAFFALEDTRTPLVAGLVSVGVGIAFNLLLIRLMSYQGLALAYSITGFLNAGLLFYFLHRKLGAFDGRRLVNTALRTIGASAVMGALVYAFDSRVLDGVTHSGGHLLSAALMLLLPIGVGALLFVLAAWVFRIPELWTVGAMVKRRVLRRAA